MTAAASSDRVIVMDLDGTIARQGTGNTYAELLPDLGVVSVMRRYHEQGFKIVIQTARNMRTYEGSIGLINVHTLPVILEWLDLHQVPFDEVIVGKPWCGPGGFYVDDRAIRPDEFKSLALSEIDNLLGANVDKQ